MPFFKASVREDGSKHIFIKAHTWYDARNIARHLFPQESMEMLWTQMEMQDEAPSKTTCIFEMKEGEVVKTSGPEKSTTRKETKKRPKRVVTRRNYTKRPC